MVSPEKKEKSTQIKDLIEKLKSLENEHMEYNNINVLNQIQDTKQTLNNPHERQMEKRAKFIKQHFYENGTKI